MKIEDEKAAPELESYVAEFYKDRLLELDQVKKNFDTEDFDSIRKIAHKWKGFSSPYGFHQLESLSSDLELSCENSEAEETLQTIQKITSYLTEKGKILRLDRQNYGKF